MNLAVKIMICLVALGFAIYGNIDRNNKLTEIRRVIPVLEKEVKKVHFENIQLQYEVDRFESPVHLMEILRKPEFSHLKFPLAEDVIVIHGEKHGA